MFATLASPRPSPQQQQQQQRTPKRTAATIPKAAAELGVNPRTLKGWFKDGAPKTIGAYDLDAIEAWCDAKGLKRKAKGDLADRLKLAMIAKTEQQGRIAQMKADAMQGRMLDREEVELFISELLVWVRNGIESIPDELMMLFPVDQRDDLREETANKIFSILTRLSREYEIWIHEQAKRSNAAS